MRKPLVIAFAAMSGWLAAGPSGLAATAVYSESGGIVAVEAEHVASRTDQTDDPQHGWKVIPTEDPGDQEFLNARGGQYVQVLPNTGDNANVPERVLNPPYADYYVEINTPGTYRLWLRWGGYSGDSDSMYASIVELKDGPGGTVADWYRYGRNINDATAGNNDFNRGWDGNGGFESNSGDAGGNPTTWDIQYPGVYTIRLTMREDSAAVDTILLQSTSAPDPGNPGPTESASSTQYVRITTQPKTTAVSPGQTGTFSVAAEGTGTITYQWQQKAPGAADFSNVSGATSASYTTAAATSAMTGTQYRVVVSNGTKTVNSFPATLTADAAPPAIQRIIGGPLPNQVTIQFDEDVDPASAGTTGNYAINGLTISSATVVRNRVILGTSAQTGGTSYNLTVNGVKDAIGNTLNGGSGSFRGAVRVPGMLRVDLYGGISGTVVADLTNNAAYPNSPRQTLFWNDFGPFASGNPYGDNYGGRVTGYVVPPVSGSYKFYLRSDDSSELSLSTNDDPANLAQIAVQEACCNAFTDSEGTLSSAPIELQAGQRYYIQALWKEGGGDDYLQVGWRTPNDADLNDPTGLTQIPGQFLEALVDAGASLEITLQPSNVTAQASSPATFRVGYTANSVLMGTNATVQWQRAPSGSATFTDIAGATSATYTIAFATPQDNGAQYRAVLSIGSLTNVTSSAATLTVSAETVPPVVASASADTGNVYVVFNEPMDSATLSTSGNYTLDNGATVTGATPVSTASGAGAVRLAATLTPGQTYNLTINNLKDASGNTIAANTKVSFMPFHVLASFDDGVLPAGAAVTGPANVKASGSYNGSGFAEITPNRNDLQGSLILPDTGTESVSKFTATWKMFLGNGTATPADGFSFALSPGLDDTTNFGEEGTGSGLIVSFDTYDNGSAEAPAISVKYGGTAETPVEEGGNQVVKTNVPAAALVNNQWVDVAVQVTEAGKVTVIHNNVKYFDNVQIEGWVPIDSPRAAFGGRTGNLNEANWIDDIAILYNADVALAQPPTIVITAPANNATFPVNSTVNLTVNAQAPGGAVAKVEYFANGQSLGTVTSAPYSLAIPNVPQGAYNVVAAITDARGVTVRSSAIKVVVGTPEKVLFITAVAGPNASDQQVIDRLYGLGFDVVVVGDTDSQESDTEGKVLLITSSLVGSGNVAGKFDNAPIPILNWEAALQDNYLFTTDEDTVTRGVTGGQTQLRILDATHPLAAGLSGTVAVADAGVEFSWGNPAPSAIKIGQLTDGSTDHYGLYAFDTGATLLDGTTKAAARRVHFPAGDATYAGLNANGKKLFDAAINWLLNRTVEPGEATATIVRNGNTITVGSTDGGTVQATDTLTPPSWQDIGAAPQNVQPSGRARFFRIKK